jgi:hypothetical protein
MNSEEVGASFRDPSGFVVRHRGEYLRVVREVYRTHYEHLRDSGLYRELVDQGLLVPHEEIVSGPLFPEAYLVLRPRQLDFVSYPYEWCFSQLKDAALLTLQIQRAAMRHGLSLKDASAFNIQFLDGRPVLIDTLSFETMTAAKPWVAYHQFCRHFLAPLALMSYRDGRLGALLRLHLDGVPLPLAAKLLPWRSCASFGLLVHLHLHAAGLSSLSGRNPQKAPGRYSSSSLHGLIGSLESSVRRLRWNVPRTAWRDYYRADVASSAYLHHKQGLIERLLEEPKPKSVWDLGTNTGLFSRVCTARGIRTVSFDADPACVEMNYLQCKKLNDKLLLPLVLDLTNPSPALGWENLERLPWLERPTPDLALALALVHHLAIGHNVPFKRLARLFHRVGPWLIVEWVPKNDPMAQGLLRAREDIFADYTLAAFEEQFASYFEVRHREPLQDSQRVLYVMRRK